MAVNPLAQPRMISIPVSPYCELARWALDRLGIAYFEECHAPVFHALSLRRYTTSSDVPVLLTGDAILINARQVVDYYESRSAQDRRLYPDDSRSRAQAQQWFDHMYDVFGIAVRAWAYAYMLPFRRSTARVWVTRVPLVERVAVPIIYPILRAALGGNLGLTPNTIPEQRAIIDATFDKVEALLADGRRYLLGDRFTAADLALAALAAPAILPLEYGGPIQSWDEMPPAMRADVQHLRNRPAGQYILRLYREARPHPALYVPPPAKPGMGADIKAALLARLTSPGAQRRIFALLRRAAPILVIGKRTIVTRHADVTDVLARDTDFTISEVNAVPINRIDGPFILGMDRSPQYEREAATLREVVRREDLPRIRSFVAETAAACIRAAQPQAQIDVVSDLARLVPTRLLGAYFGFPGPDEPTMMRWMRAIFYDIFENVGNDPHVRRDALEAREGLRAYMDAEISRRKTLLGQPGQPDDVLGRLLALQDAAHPWLDDNAVRRNIGGMIVGAVDTTSQFVTHAIDELVRQPTALASVREAALAGDIECVRRYAYEAVRFKPISAFLLRYCRSATLVAAGTRRARRIPANSFVLVGVMSAMFDAEGFAAPDEFRVDRQVEYLHFGAGLHRCFGRAINGVQIPELVAALLRLPHLRRAPGSAGQIVYAGPFPDHLILKFDRGATHGGTL
jgi:cytochrome P450/glutathione S-transferase